MGATRRTGRKTNLVLEETKADGTKRQRLVNRETLCSVLCFYEEALEELQEVGAKAKDIINKKGGNFMSENVTIQNKLLGKTFFWMFLGLLGSGILAWYTYSSGLFMKILTGDYFEILLIAELVVVLIFSLLFKKLPPLIVGILYFVYSMINGVTLSVIFVVFELSSVLYLFAISALLFAALGFIGYKTTYDLTSWKPYLSVFLIADEA